MKKSMVFVNMLTLAGLLVLGCSNDNGINCPNDFTGGLSTTETEFAGVWEFIEMVSEQDIDLTNDQMDNPSTNIYDQLEDCQKDLSYIFEEDRGYILKQGYEAVNCTNKAMFDGTWKLTTGVLTFVGNCSMESIDIEFNENMTQFMFEKTYKFLDVDGKSITTKVTFTYEKFPN